MLLVVVDCGSCLLLLGACWSLLLFVVVVFCRRVLLFAICLCRCSLCIDWCFVYFVVVFVVVGCCLMIDVVVVWCCVGVVGCWRCVLFVVCRGCCCSCCLMWCVVVCASFTLAAFA